MKVEVRLFGMYKEAAHASVLQEELDGQASLGKLLNRLADRYGETFRNLTDAHSGVLLFHNSDIVREPSARLQEGAVIKIVPAVPGG